MQYTNSPNYHIQETRSKGKWEGKDMGFEEMSPGKTDLQDDPLSREDSKTSTVKKKRGGKNVRRFSNEQVRSLETIFESETKLEPRKKVQVARELGLQPKQVAIWFQNKRARWKSKEIEKNFRVLKANYDSLNARFETLKKEKESLLLQLEELRSIVNEKDERSSRRKEFQGNCLQNIGEENEETIMLFAAVEPGGLRERLDLSPEDPHQANTSEDIDVSLVPPARWCSSDPGSLYEQLQNGSQWWESWNWFTTAKSES